LSLFCRYACRYPVPFYITQDTVQYLDHGIFCSKALLLLPVVDPLAGRIAADPGCAGAGEPHALRLTLDIIQRALTAHRIALA